MRTVRTLILRLLVDTDHPQSLHGVLQAVGGSDLHSFTDEQSLLSLVHRLSCPDSKPTRDGEGQDLPVEIDI